MKKGLENASDQYEIEVSKALFESWGKDTNENDLSQRVARARIVTHEADRLLTPAQKLAVIRIARKFLDDNWAELALKFNFESLNNLRDEFDEIIQSKGVEGKSLHELHRETVAIFLEQGEFDKDSANIEMKIADFKALVFAILKETVQDKITVEELKRIIELQGELDKLSDRLRDDEPFEEVIHQTLQLLIERLGLKGAALSYELPLQKDVKFGDDDYPAGEIGEDKLPIAGDVRKDDVKFAIKRGREMLEEDKSEDIFEKIPAGDEEERHFIFKVEIDGRELGYMDLVVANEDQISDEFITLARHIEAHVDSLVDVGLSSLVKRNLGEVINSISVNTDICDLPEAFKKYLALLSQFIDAEIIFECQSALINEPDGGYKVTPRGIKPFGSGVLNCDNPYIRPIVDNRKKLKTPEGAERRHDVIGRLIVSGKNQLNESQKEAIEIVSELLNQEILTRKAVLSQSIEGDGHLVGKAALEGKLEWRGEHPVVVTMIDIEGSTKFCEDLNEKPGGKDRYRRMINKLYKRQSEIELNPDFPSVFDKPEGDKIILLTGPPFTTDGKDVFGDKKHNVGKYIAVALHNAQIVKKIWNEILDEEEAKYGSLPYRPKLCTGIEFSESAGVGFFGKDEFDEGESSKDYTVIDSVSNEASRIQDKASGSEILLSRAAWQKLKEFYESGELSEEDIQIFTRMGLPIDIMGKGVANPIEVVKVVPIEESEKTVLEQRELFERKTKEVGKNGIAFNSIDELCDGDYIVQSVADTKADVAKMNIEFEDMPLGAIFSKEKLPEFEYAVSIDVHKKLLEEEKKSGYSNRKILRIKHGRSYIVRYECIENLQVEKILELLRKSEEQGRGIFIDPGELPSGQYQIINHEDRGDGEHMYELKRMRESLKVIVHDDQIQGDAADTGLLIYESRKFSCKTASPEWAGLV